MQASGDTPEAFPTSMSTDQAYDLLGLKEGAGFDEILTAKNKLTKASDGDRDKIVQVTF